MLACARLGAVHSVVFGGFAGPLGFKKPTGSRDASGVMFITPRHDLRPRPELATRIKDAQPKAVIWASCGVEPKGL